MVGAWGGHRLGAGPAGGPPPGGVHGWGWGGHKLGAYVWRGAKVQGRGARSGGGVHAGRNIHGSTPLCMVCVGGAVLSGSDGSQPPTSAASSPPCLSCPPAPPTLHSLCSLGSDSTIAHHTSHVLQITCPEPSCCASMHTRCRASLRNTHPRHAAHVAQALRLRVHSHRNERGITHLPPTFSSRRCMLNRRTCSVTARRPPCAGLAAWGPS